MLRNPIFLIDVPNSDSINLQLSDNKLFSNGHILGVVAKVKFGSRLLTERAPFFIRAS